MDYKSLLNDKQFEAVSTDSQYVRIVAGAGSGKTRVLTYRIAFLISEFHVDPSKILAIAFTNKVAAEMNERASKLVSELFGRTPILNISTFHAFCSRFLRIEHQAIGYPMSYTIYDEDDQAKLIRACAVELGFKKGDEIVKEATKYIRAKKARGLYPEDISIEKNSFRDEKDELRIFLEYELRKTASFGMDFDDLLNKTIEVLEQNKDIREKWSSRFSHILIDEFQDTNDVQFKLVKLLLRPETAVYVVGDPDQTIYTWRGANQKIIMNFDLTFRGAKTIFLNQNYRSTKTILEAANKLIANNKKRLPKDLFTKGPLGSAITTHNAPDSTGEAEWVARKIAGLANETTGEDGKAYYGNTAILYRASSMTRSFEVALKDRGIPYRIFGGLRFYERMEVKDLLAYFNLMLNPLDDIAFERIINVPRRKIGDTTIERIRREAHSRKLSEYNYVMSIIGTDSDTEIPTRALKSLESLLLLMEKTKKRLLGGLEVYSGVLKDFVTDLGYFDYLKENEEADEDRIGNVNALFDDINHFVSNNEEASFADYLQNVSLLTSQDDIQNGNYVSLMTIHIAKGLEFDNVFVICMNEGMFPSNRALMETDRDGEEEERRLAYVAMTRAKKNLFCTCNSGYSYITDSHSKPSEYFVEAGLKINRGGAFFSDSAFSNSRLRDRNSSRFERFFEDDGDNFDPFEKPHKKEVSPAPPKPLSNGIHDWKVGEKAHHEKFGDGVVTAIIGNNIITVNFESCGNKTLLGTHAMLTRIKSLGGDA